MNTLKDIAYLMVVLATTIPFYLLWVIHPRDYLIFFLCYALGTAILYVHGCIGDEVRGRFGYV